MVSEKLLPCPFCGGEARYEWHSADPCWIECNACGAVGPNDTHTTTEANAAAWNTRAPADLRSALEAAQKDRDTAQSAVEAWAEVCERLEAHLQDRVAMQDEANPAVFLSILRSSMANVQRGSEQIRAARWADYARQEAKIATLEAETIERCAKVCEQLAAGCRAELKDPANETRTIAVLDGHISAYTTIAANIRALAPTKEPAA